jgi:hypothetical protein
MAFAFIFGAWAIGYGIAMANTGGVSYEHNNRRARYRAISFTFAVLTSLCVAASIFVALAES